MTTVEGFYLIVVVAAFLAFGATLYRVGRPNQQ
jgi:hypothetical protein